MFSQLVTRKSKKTNAKHRKGNPSSRMSSSKPRACTYTNGSWTCELANGRRLQVSGQSLIKALRSVTGRAKDSRINRALVKYPRSGQGACMVHITYHNGRTAVVRGRCGSTRPSNPAPTQALAAPVRPSAALPQPGDGTAGTTEPPYLGPRCCFNPETMKLVCSGGEGNPYTDADVLEIVKLDEEAEIATVRIKLREQAGGRAREMVVRCPLCGDGAEETPDTPADRTLTFQTECCYDPKTNTLKCSDPNDPLQGVAVVLETVGDNGLATVYLEGDPQRGMRIPVCADEDTPEKPRGDECCYDAATNTIVCTDPRNPLNGQPVTVEVINENAGPNGETLATVYVNGDPSKGLRLPLCETPECCVDLATATLVCDDTSSPYHGLSVNVEQVGVNSARVAHPDLKPYGFAYLPLCDTPPKTEGGCCFDQDTMTIVCEDETNPLHGTSAGIVLEFVHENMPWVSVAWAGGATRLPLCGERPPEECPPAYCCVNIDMMTFVCPGSPELNNKPANVANIVEQGGYNYAVLADGTMVPICGRDCPPPQLCPEGLWLSPTGECTTPECPECPTPPPCPECPESGDCPQCPPGTLLDTQTGRCVTCPPCDGRPPRGPQVPEQPCCDEPWWKKAGHCCESCALGKECDGGCGDDCGCGKEGHGHGHPQTPAWAQPASFMLGHAS